MKIVNDNNNRCGIFLYYDAQGIVDDYVIYLLKELKPYLRRLLVVINGSVKPEEQTKLESVADEVMPRDNEGFDVGGYRAGIFHEGLDELAKYDETILFNYTYYGPLFPFSEMFDKMNKMDLDFWGITKHFKVDPDPFGVNRYGFMPEHIQSHFLVLRKDFVKSEDYRQFITKLKNPTSYVESICNYETIFTKHFEDLGYKWDVYVDTSEYEGYNFAPVMFSIKDLIEKKRCPIIKRRSFFTDYYDFLFNTCGESSIDAYEYLKENVDYDVNMIWDNLLRLENMSEIARAMQFNYMLPVNESFEVNVGKKLAIFVYVEKAKRAELYLKYLRDLQQNVDIFFLGKEEELASIEVDRISGRCEKVCINSGKLTESFEILITYKNKYDYICMMSINDVEKGEQYINYESWQYRDWENMLGSKNIVNNVVATFEENERLGLMAPPVPFHGELFVEQGDGWQYKFDDVKEYVSLVAPRVNCKKAEPPQAPFGGCFWVRSSALPDKICIKMNNRIIKDNILLMALVYIVQYNKYYSGVCYSNKYSAIDVTNYDYMLREINKTVFKKYGPNYHKTVVENIINDNSLSYSRAIKEKMKSVIKKVLPKKMYTSMKRVYKKGKKS